MNEKMIIEKQVGTRVISETFGIPRQTIIDMVHAGRIPCVNPPLPHEDRAGTTKPFFFYLSQVEQWYRNGRRMPQPEQKNRRRRRKKKSWDQIVAEAREAGFRVE